jgi:hypothetical protein
MQITAHPTVQLATVQAQQAAGQTQQVRRAALFKLSSWNVLAAAKLLALQPSTPWIFLYRDPVEVAVSELRAAGGWLELGRCNPKLFASMFGWSPLSGNKGDTGKK